MVPPPDRIPANTPPEQIVLVQSAKLLDLGLMHHMVASKVMFISQIVAEVMRDVPDADFIEIRAIRYDVKEESNERSASPSSPEE